MRTGWPESSSPYPKRSLPILGNKVTPEEGNDLGVRLAEKSDYLVVARKRVKARGAKGIMKMRTTKLEQLNLVFADSPQGGQAEEVPNLLGTAKARLHKAKDKELRGFVTGAADASWLLDAVASEMNLLTIHSCSAPHSCPFNLETTALGPIRSYRRACRIGTAGISFS